MISRRQAVEAALRAWREAERALAGTIGDTRSIRAEIAVQRDEFQRLSTDPAVDPRDVLVELEPTGG